jgi:hypothetical protein
MNKPTQKHDHNCADLRQEFRVAADQFQRASGFKKLLVIANGANMAASVAIVSYGSSRFLNHIYDAMTYGDGKIGLLDIAPLPLVVLSAVAFRWSKNQVRQSLRSEFG